MAVLYLLYLLLCVVPARGKLRAGAVARIVCLLAIRSVLWLYLCMVDRVLDRVTMPLLMAEFGMLVSFLSATAKGRAAALSG